ncbi:hypothetical protein L9F63_002042, partial [Diploptera punctata]
CNDIEVPIVFRVRPSRKRRPSSSQDDKEDYMDECTAALVLMSLSCSPNSPNFNVATTHIVMIPSSFILTRGSAII